LASDLDIDELNFMKIEGIGPKYATSKSKTTFVVTISNANNFSTRFRELDNEELHNVDICGRRRNKHLKSWVINTFDEWRKFKGYALD
jgi:hypothetical protein